MSCSQERSGRTDNLETWFLLSSDQIKKNTGLDWAFHCFTAHTIKRSRLLVIWALFLIVNTFLRTSFANYLYSHLCSSNYPVRGRSSIRSLPCNSSAEETKAFPDEPKDVIPAMCSGSAQDHLKHLTREMPELPQPVPLDAENSKKAKNDPKKRLTLPDNTLASRGKSEAEVGLGDFKM